MSAAVSSGLGAVSGARPEHLVQDLEQALEDASPPTKTAGPPSRSAVPKHLLGKPTIAGLLRFALLDWAVIGACWAAIALGPSWLYPVLALVIAGRLHSFGVVLHDATHMPLRGKTLGVRAVEILCGYPIATTLNAMRYHHLRHHRDSGMATDPYFKPSVRGNRLVFAAIWLRHLLLVPFWTIRGVYGLVAVVVPGMRTGYARAFLQDRSGKDLRDDPEVLACAKSELGQVLFHVLVFTFTALQPEIALYYYFIPAVLAGLLAGYRVLVEHDYLPTTDRSVMTILSTTNDHDLGVLGQILLAPRNIGYHVVHHLHPQVALENLPALREWYRTAHPAIYPAPKG